MMRRFSVLCAVLAIASASLPASAARPPGCVGPAVALNEPGTAAVLERGSGVDYFETAFSDQARFEIVSHELVRLKVERYIDSDSCTRTTVCELMAARTTCDAGAGEHVITVSLANLGPTAYVLLFDRIPDLPAGWNETAVIGATDDDVPIVDQNVVVVDGQPNQSDPRMYDVTLTVGDTQQPTVGVFLGFPGPFVHEELLHTEQAVDEVAILVRYRYDPSQRVCLLAVGGECRAVAPLDPTNPGWLASSGRTASLFVDVQADVNGTTIDESVEIPLAGQAGASL